jgi:hypothetical protein
VGGLLGFSKMPSLGREVLPAYRPRIVQCELAAMKKIMGTNSKKFVREARNACRARTAALAGGARQGSADDLLVIAPDNSPDIEQHDEA